MRLSEDAEWRSLRAQLGGDFSVDGDLALLDQFFGFAARGNAGAGDDFLKAFLHCGSVVLIAKGDPSPIRKRGAHKSLCREARLFQRPASKADTA